MRLKLLALSAVALLTVGAYAQRKPTVTYTVSGGAGAWDLNFNVKNNFNSGEGQIYFFGVLLDTGRNIQGSPGIWDPNTWTSWNNSGYGGSNTTYNNVWIELTFSQTIPEGGNLGGFVARATGTSAPTQVQFFAFAFNGTYQGNDYFNNANNPGFEGLANPVPEPASMVVLGVGLAALARRKRK